MFANFPGERNLDKSIPVVSEDPERGPQKHGALGKALTREAICAILTRNAPTALGHGNECSRMRR